MKKQLIYRYLASSLLILLLACAGFSNVVSAQVLRSAENAVPITDLIQNNINAANSLFGDNPSLNSYTQTNTSVNTGTAESPTRAGGSGNKETEWGLKILSPYYWIPAGLRIIGNTILMMFGWVLGLVGLIFNFIIDKTIVNLKSTVDSLGIITDIWKVIRDFINLFFIFALLYAAVGTILGLDKVDWKKTVGNLILAALLINFSLFITKAALDLSNIVTIGFYSQLPGVGAVGSGAINPALNQSNAGGISNSIMQSLKLETIYKPQYTGGGVSGVLGDAANAPVNTFAYILSTVMGSIFICVTIVVMVAACWLFLKRFVDIIFLMVRSPIAFAGFVLPQLSEYQSNWWKELQANVLFPPVYMAMMWITFKILQSPGFQTVAPGVDGFSGLFSSLSATTINITFRFIVVIAMMVYALKSASKAGIEGGEVFNDFMKKKRDQMAGAVSGAIGRNTLGRSAAWMQDKNSAAGQALRKLESVPIIGSATSKAITGGLKNVSGATFGGAKGGFDQAVKDEAKYAKEGYARVGEKQEWRETFAMKEPTAPTMPERLTGESDDKFAGRMAKYHQDKAKYEHEDLPEYENAKVDYTDRKKRFEEKQKKNAEERQQQFKGNYEKTTVFSAAHQSRPASIPFLAENRAALKSIDEKIEADKKKEDKTNEQNKEWQEALLFFLKQHGEEARASIDPAISPVGNDPARPGEMSAEAATLRRTVVGEFESEKTEIEGIADKKERAKRLDEIWKKYKAMEEKIVEDEVVLLETITHRMETATVDQKEILFKQKMRIKKSQRARNELHKRLEKMAEKRERAEEKEREKKEREEKDKKDSGGDDKKDKK